jgi:GT2 family glycosyltransferase
VSGGSASIVVATFGHPRWQAIARFRAVPSAKRQTTSAGLHVMHGEALHEARNAGAAAAEGEWLIFLDADDELDRGYVTAMLAAAGPDVDLIQPARQSVVDGRDVGEPEMLAARPLTSSNYLVVGTAVRASLFAEVGGFDDWPLYEDWDLWLRCVHAGGRIGAAPAAVYRWWRKAGSRNDAPRDVQRRTYAAIRRRAVAARRGRDDRATRVH